MRTIQPIRRPGFAGAALVAALLLAPAALPAQDTPASLMIELESALARKAPAPGAPVPFAHTVDWEKTIDAIGSILARSAGMPAEPHALFHLGNAYYSAERFAEARETFEDLRRRFPDHPLCRVKIDPDNAKSLVETAIDDCIDEMAFRQKNTVNTLPRPVIDPDLTVTLHLSAGKVKMRFYKNAAPKHRENFLKLAREGFYDRTRIHRVVPGLLVHLGDPGSKENNPAEWGKGEPGWSLESEYSLATHKAGTVSMWRGPGKPRSHGCQFQFILQDQPHLDFVQTPFAEVIEGLDVIEKISRMSRNQYEAPVEEIWVNGITIEK